MAERIACWDTSLSYLIFTLPSMLISLGAPLWACVLSLYLLVGRVVALARPLVADALGVGEPEPFCEGDDGLRGVREEEDEPWCAIAGR